MRDSLRRRIVRYLHERPREPYTNSDLAFELSAPEPSVRRATLHALSLGDIVEVGKTSWHAYLYQAGQASRELSF